MADVKISALPAASTPLTGGEVLPIVQSSTTKQVAVSNLTAGLAGTASININGTVGATTPTTGAFTSGTFSTTLGVTGQTNVATSSGFLYVRQSAQITGAMIEAQQTAGLYGLGINGAAGEDAVVYLRINGGGSGGIVASNGNLVFKPGNAAAMTLASGGAVTIPGTLGVTGATTLQGITVGLGAGAISTNTAVGYQALFGNTSGAYNTAIGNQALYSNTTTNFNVAIGDRALYSNTTGTQNTGSGIQALYSNLTGIYNTADGAQALYNNTGSYNTGIGHSALSGNTSGSGNTALSPNNSAGAYAPVFDPTTQSNRFCMGSTGVTNAYIQVAWTVVSDARDKTDFAPVPHGLDFVSKLKPTSYRYKMSREDTEGHGPIRYGFKAQDVLALEGIDPVIVDAEDAEKLRFNDQSMIAVLVNAIQELAAKVTALEAK